MIECGAADYGDLVDPENVLLRDKSHTEVADALDELLSLPYGSVGTLIIDPITQIWQSLQIVMYLALVRKEQNSRRCTF